MKNGVIRLVCMVGICLVAVNGYAGPIKALIVDGQNNHRWQETSPIMQKIMDGSGLFKVEVATSPGKGKDMKSFAPKFSDYDVVVLNYNGAMWSEETQKGFVEYVKGGGGVVVVHAANNSFGNWQEYNRIIGLGGWGGRSEKHGPYVFYKDDKVVRDTGKGRGGSHGAQHEFLVKIRDNDHPVTKGMPEVWKHAKDELYDSLRGPAEEMHILATSYSDKSKKHEPMIFTVKYGNGSVFHTPMGHAGYSMKCVGFAVTLLRGAEWAATGKVTQKLPADFPTADKVSPLNP